MKLIASLALAALVGCARATTVVPANEASLPPPVEPADAGQAEVPASSALTIDRDGYHIEVPAGWTEATDKETKDHAVVQTSFFASSDSKVGATYEVLGIDMLQLVARDTAETFPVTVSGELPEIFGKDGTDAVIAGRRLVTINGNRCSMTALMRADKVGIMTLACAKGRTGYLVSCMGDVSQDAVVQTCVGIQNTFTLVH